MLRWIALAALLLFPLPALAAPEPVNVVYAGSLVTAFEHSIGPAFERHGFIYRGEGRGSVALGNMIRDGVRTPDVFVSADTAVVDALQPRTVRWYAVFATTRMVIGYSPKSVFAGRLEEARLGKRPWTDVLLAPGLKIGRTDPALDPKGYRSVMVAQLAERHFAYPNFARRLLGEDRNAAQIVPEEDLLVRLEAGEFDAAFLYATEAVARKLPFIELPPSINLSDPHFSAQYSSARVTLGGKQRVGGPIAYALTVPAVAKNPLGGQAFVEFLLGREGQSLLRASGLTIVPAQLAGESSAVPARLARVFTAGRIGR